MKSEKLKISVAQRILNLSNDKLLKKIADILDKENVIGYDEEGNPITDEEYIKDINAALLELKEENLETYTSEEVKRRILGQ
ncbi:hypothetical protein D3C87_427600 [compost metagenome]